jgi:4-hydroxybenzoate polyprenyltransferase
MRPLLALLRSAHPGPVAGVTLIVVLLGVAVGLDAARVALLGTTLALNQLSIGLGNDWLDADRDRAAGRADKPVAAGTVSVALVRGLALALAGLTVLVSLTLGLPFAVVHTLAFAGGWIYNAWLKRTAFSALPYLVSFGLLPTLATLALPAPALAAWWATAAAALLGLAAHLANVLPDLAADDATGVRGFPHRLGARGSTLVAGVALAGAAVALAVGVGPSVLAVVGLGLSLAASAAAVVRGLTRSRWAFRLVILAAVIDVALLVAAGSAMVAP